MVRPGYITFANKLDAARLGAAKQGAAAYQREIDAEKKTAASDPSIAGMEAAGFSESCQARWVARLSRCRRGP
jgi:hypothetical protein